MAESTAFPWLKHLPEDAQREFFEELSEAFGEAQFRTKPGVLVSPQTYVEVLDPLLTSWKATAEVHADPELYKSLMEAIDEDDEERFVEVLRPELCPSNIPCNVKADTAHWCARAAGHEDRHKDRTGEHTWTDEEARAARDHSSEGADGFDTALGRITLEDCQKALEKLYGGDWSSRIVARQSGPDYVIPTQREAGEEEGTCG